MQSIPGCPAGKANGKQPAASATTSISVRDGVLAMTYTAPPDSVPMLPCAVTILSSSLCLGLLFPLFLKCSSCAPAPRPLPLQGCSSSVSTFRTHCSSQSLFKCPLPTRPSLTTLFTVTRPHPAPGMLLPSFIFSRALTAITHVCILLVQ